MRIIEQTVYTFAYWIYSRLESEYEYLQSDEALNEYEFTAEGELI